MGVLGFSFYGFRFEILWLWQFAGSAFRATYRSEGFCWASSRVLGVPVSYNTTRNPINFISLLDALTVL